MAAVVLDQHPPSLSGWTGLAAPAACLAQPTTGDMQQLSSLPISASQQNQLAYPAPNMRYRTAAPAHAPAAASSQPQYQQLAARLAARHTQQQSQQPQQRKQRRGCLHCILCTDLKRHVHNAAAFARTSAGSLPRPEDSEWWPAGLSSPTLYFQLRRRQLHVHYRSFATPAASAKLWRPTAQTRSEPSELLARRFRRQLGLLIPTTYTNVQQSSSTIELIGIKDVPVTRRPSSHHPHQQQQQQQQQQQLAADAAHPSASPSSAAAADAAEVTRHLQQTRLSNGSGSSGSSGSLPHSTAAPGFVAKRAMSVQGQPAGAAGGGLVESPAKRSRLVAPAPPQPALPTTTPAVAPMPVPAPVRRADAYAALVQQLEREQGQQAQQLSLQPQCWGPPAGRRLSADQPAPLAYAHLGQQLSWPQYQAPQQQAPLCHPQRQRLSAPHQLQGCANSAPDSLDATPIGLVTALTNAANLLPLQQPTTAGTAQAQPLFTAPLAAPAPLSSSSTSSTCSSYLLSSQGSGEGLLLLQPPLGTAGSGSQPLLTATSVLPPPLPHAVHDVEAQQVQQQQQQQYYQRQLAIKAERAYPCHQVIDLASLQQHRTTAPHQPQGVEQQHHQLHSLPLAPPSTQQHQEQDQLLSSALAVLSRLASSLGLKRKVASASF